MRVFTVTGSYQIRRRVWRRLERIKLWYEAADATNVQANFVVKPYRVHFSLFLMELYFKIMPSIQRIPSAFALNIQQHNFESPRCTPKKAYKNYRRPYIAASSRPSIVHTRIIIKPKVYQDKKHESKIFPKGIKTLPEATNKSLSIRK
ncbi:hypothetical protein GWI33_017197 [Rhynchophorus ferrugineus]|uniref:Uncharacterized protein n=1 Tax=Rhynchophorus ferrugineus TaxID=354439 RepID=A0A834M6F2_RHYFE|nr:hypothetical protein GWI33_017197 [Rhynchophorus ferrugineus]